MADINDLIARGITPPAAPDLIGNLSKATAIQQQRANIGQTQAQTGLLGAQQQEATARAGAVQTQQQGEAIANALKYRQLQAYRVLQGLIQQNTVKNPDGTTSTNMPAVMGAYAQQFPDYAIDLRQRQIAMQQKQTELAKSGLDLSIARNQRLGLVLGLGGANDPNSPVAPQKYAQIKAQADQEGIGEGLPTAAEYAKNPAAYAQKLSDMVNSSGSKTAVLQQQKAQVEAGQQQRDMARKEYSALMANATPDQYGAVYNKVGADFPNVFPQLDLIPPNQITPQNFQWAQQSARLMSMTPEQQQAAITELYKAQNLAHLQGLQGVEAGARANEASTNAAVAKGTFEQNYGQNPFNGALVQPPPGTSAPVVNLPGGKGQVDLSQGNTPQSRAWQAAPPAVQQAAKSILAGQNVSSDNPIGRRAMDLATKIDPNIVANSAARKTWYEKQQPAITAMNAATGHGEDLIDYAKQLDQRSPGFINKPVADLKETFGNQAQAAYNNVVANYTSEIGNAIKGGALTQQEGQEAIDRLGKAKTLGQVISVVKSNSQLLARRGEAMNNQFNQQLGGNILGGGIDVFQPRTKQILEKQGALKSATQQNISAYAAKKGIPVAKAAQEFKDAGYSIK